MARVTLRNLQPGRTYKFQMRSVSEDDVSEWSPRYEFQAPIDLGAPDTPVWASIGAFIPDGTSFVANWNHINFTLVKNMDFKEYELELSGNSKTFVFRTTDNFFTLTYEQNKALWGTPCPNLSARLRASDKSNNFSPWTDPAITATNAKPDAPSSISAVAGADQIGVTWTASASTDVTKYRLYVGSSAGFTPATNNKIFEGNALNFSYTTQTYSDQFFKVVAVDVFNLASDPTATTTAVQPGSPFSGDTVPPSEPTWNDWDLPPNPDGFGANAYLNWIPEGDLSDIAGFEIRYRRADGDTYQFGGVYGSDVQITRLQVEDAYTDYYFSVRAFDGSNNYSGWVEQFVPGYVESQPNPVTGFTSVAARDGIRYAWNQTTELNVDNYHIQVSTVSDFSSSVTNFNTGIGNSLTINGLPTNTTYYARIRAITTTDYPGPWSATDTRTTLNYSGVITVTADVIQSGTLGAAIDIGLGSYLRLNGGYIKSASYTGNTASNSNGSAGFYLGDDGITINRGKISAEAFQGGSFTTGTITMAGGSITGAGWTLSSSGLSIPNGAIDASKLNIQSGINLINPMYSDFEGQKAFYSNDGGVYAAQGGLIISQNLGGKFNKYSLGTLWGTNTVPPQVGLGRNATDYNINVTGGKTYIFSAYVWCAGSIQTNIKMKVKWSTGAIVSLTTDVGQSNNVDLAPGADQTYAQRISGYAVAPAGVTGAQLIFESATLTSGGGFNVDGVQVESKEFGSNYASFWKPGTSTTIDGGLITTGSIRSTEPALTEYGQVVPNEWAWELKMNGDAVFGNAKVRGSMVVGNANYATQVSTIQSGNYQPGESGWVLRSDGTGQLLSLEADSITGGAIVTGSLSALALDDSDMESVINLMGTIQATGSLGEVVSMGADGFQVLGSQEIDVTFKSQSGTVVTLTTGGVHGYAAGSEVIVSNVGGPFPNEPTRYTILAAASNQFTIDGFTSATMASTQVFGLAQGKDTSSTPRDKPVYVDFPTDGSKPNIISGILTASRLVVTGGSTFRGVNTIEPGAFMVISSAVVAPTTPPQVGYNYNEQLFSGFTGTRITGVCIGHNGNVFISSDNNSKAMWITEHNASTGAYIATRWSNAGMVGPYALTVKSYGLVYYNNKYYHLVRDTNNAPSGGQSGEPNDYTNDVITTFNTSWVDSGQTLLFSRDMGLPGSTANYYAEQRLGFDHISNRILVGAAQVNDGNKARVSNQVRMYNLNASGIPTVSTYTADYGVPAATVSLTGTGPNINSIAYIGRGNFDFGGERFVLKSQNASTSAWTNYLVFNSAGARPNALEDWLGRRATLYGGYWNTTNNRFYSMTSNGSRQEYSGSGDSLWSGTDFQRTRFAAYSWRDSNTAGTVSNGVDGTHETQLGAIGSALVPKRAYVNVTITAIPKGLGNDTPTEARVWISTDAVAPAITSTNWKHRATIIYQLTTAKIDPTTTAGFGSTPKGSNEFAALTADFGTIQSESGTSWWKGDGSAQFAAPVTLNGATWTTVTSFTTAGYTTVTGQPVQYRKDVAGNVAVRGAVTKATTVTGDTLFTLPPGFRPTQDWHTIIRTNVNTGYARMIISATTGVVSVAFSGTFTAFGLETTFPTF